MTQKAHALGMSRTTYVNASGLPNDDQITTARDQALLGRAIQERYPSYYKYFSTQSFEFRGEAIHNHNHLLGSMDGVDGIKTGFTHASGFNLVTSVHRDGHYIVAVVLGGRSALERDAHMRELINAHINKAGLRRTASVFGERQHRKPQVFDNTRLSSGADPTPSTPLTAGSSDLIQSLPVKTISYHAAPSQAAALASMLLAAATLQAVAPAASAPRAQSADALSTIVADRFTTASARAPQLLEEQTASKPGTAQSRMQISNARNDATRPSSDDGTPNIKTQLTVIASANTGETLEGSAREDARSRSIQQAILREVPPAAAETSTFAKSETGKLTRAETEARTTDDTSAVQSRKRTAQSPAVITLEVFLLLSLGLPGVSILAWLVIKDTALGAQLVSNHLPLKRAGDLTSNNERLVSRFDDRADWLDDFLANWRQSLTARSEFASARKAQRLS